MSNGFVPGSIAPSRYGTATFLRTREGTFALNRVPVPSTPQVDDILHVWRDGDWLDVLAVQYFGDATLWWIIADFNDIADPRVIDAGRTLRIPSRRRFFLSIMPLFA